MSVNNITVLKIITQPESERVRIWFQTHTYFSTRSCFLGNSQLPWLPRYRVCLLQADSILPAPILFLPSPNTSLCRLPAMACFLPISLASLLSAYKDGGVLVFPSAERKEPMGNKVWREMKRREWPKKRGSRKMAKPRGEEPSWGNGGTRLPVAYLVVLTGSTAAAAEAGGPVPLAGRSPPVSGRKPWSESWGLAAWMTRSTSCQPRPGPRKQGAGAECWATWFQRETRQSSSRKAETPNPLKPSSLSPH